MLSSADMLGACFRRVVRMLLCPVSLMITAQFVWAEQVMKIDDWTFTGNPPYKCVIEVKNDVGHVFALEFYNSESSGRSGMVVVSLASTEGLPSGKAVFFHLFTTDEAPPVPRMPIRYDPHQLGPLMFSTLDNPIHYAGVASILAGGDTLRMAPYENEIFAKDFRTEWSIAGVQEALRDLIECSAALHPQ